VSETWAGSLHSACTDGACEDCLREWVACCPQGRVPCYAEGCVKFLPQKLTEHARQIKQGSCAPRACNLLLNRTQQLTSLEQARARPDAQTWEATLELAQLRTLAAHWQVEIIACCGPRQFVQSEHALFCSICSKNCPALLANACGHFACVDCWAHAAEKGLGQEQGTTLSCCEPECCAAISWGLIRGICTRTSEAIRAHIAGIDGAFAAADKAKRCEMCGEKCYTFRRNSPCGHTVCEECWVQWAENSISEASCRWKVKCCAAGCQSLIAPKLWNRLCTASPVLKDFTADAQKRKSELQSVARSGVDLSWTPSTSQAGPECVICRQPSWALLLNPCGHGACQSCWGIWAESQIPGCQAQRRDAGPCFAPECQVSVSTPLMRVLEAQSSPLLSFVSKPMVAQRRRLRSNPNFPAAVQVDCRQAGCWGLGYLGFDTVMCFICEHQWSPEDGGVPVPVDVNVEEVMGVKVKKCPKCNEYIEKNGGCDHMTCRCGYEFWWSTLAPYRP